MQRKQVSTRQTTRKAQLKGETEEKQRRTEIFWRNKAAKSKGLADNDRAAWSCLFKQHCGNQCLAPQWERQHHGPYDWGMLCWASSANREAWNGAAWSAPWRRSRPRSYLQVVVEAAAEVHVAQGHVGQLGAQEAAQLRADIHGRLLGPSLLVRRDRHPPPVVREQLLLQGQPKAGLLQLHLTPFGRWLGLCRVKNVCKTEGTLLRLQLISQSRICSVELWSPRSQKALGGHFAGFTQVLLQRGVLRNFKTYC